MLDAVSAYKIVSYTICGVGNDARPDDIVRNQCCARPSADLRDASIHAFVVCDGMGGPGKGDRAANAVCDSLYDELSVHSGALADESIYRMVENAYDMLDRMDADPSGKMGATMAMLDVHGDSAVMAHIGNCRIYHIRPGIDADSTTILYASTDHTLANYMVRKGTATLDEAIRLGRHKVLTRAMQQHMAQRCMPDIYRTADLLDDDYFLLITSAMSSEINDYGLRSVFSREGGNDRSKVNQLSLLASRCPTDHAAIVVRVRHQSESQPSHNGRSSTDNATNVRPEPTDIHTDNTPKSPKKRKSRNMNTPVAVADLFKSNKRLIKLLFALMAVLTLVMTIYYLFIHQDEHLRQAGTATESAVVTGLPGEETYGYESTPADVANAAPLPDETDTPTEDSESNDADVDVADTSTEPSPETPAETQQPTSPAEPILQE